MATFLAIFSILSGTASLLGLVHVFLGEERLRFRKLTVMAFLCASAISAYVLFVPGTYFENTVKSKIQYYSKESSDAVLLQKGQFSFAGMGKYAVMFPEPYKTPPHVEIVNSGGYDHAPHIDRVTPLQVIFERSSAGGLSLVPEGFQSFIWIATGEPLAEYDNAAH